jgi:hypothetical protein
METKMRRTLKQAHFRIDGFLALQRSVDGLDVWQLSQIETNKDKQEAAITVFTLVTIIFLPLSFVSSVFGMNTSDVRDMDNTQWVFWVVAVPITTAIVLISLWFADLLDGLPGRLMSSFNVQRRRTTVSVATQAQPPDMMDHPPGHGLVRRTTHPRPLPMGTFN